MAHVEFRNIGSIPDAEGHDLRPYLYVEMGAQGKTTICFGGGLDYEANPRDALNLLTTAQKAVALKTEVVEGTP